ncbi:MAG: LPS export ABC transporter periplasmic protein LptC [Alistipes sp.]|nr:LPS export ABC transporter periplasmic protein LptC [Alistipes sp.]
MIQRTIKYALVALLFAGGAILLSSCDNTQKPKEESLEGVLSEQSENLAIVVSENGRRSYRFFTPLLEGYTLGRDPYREFRRGIKIVTYQDDSLTSVNATLTANYAIYYEKRSLWEAKGDVVIVKHDSTKIFTQQLFWDSVTKRIYSNVDTKIETLTDTHFCEGFESDEEMNELSFRRWKGKVQMDESMMTPKDSVADNSVETPKEEPAEKPEPLPSRETVEKKRANRAKTLGKSDDGGKRAVVRKTGEASRREISRIE